MRIEAAIDDNQPLLIYLNGSEDDVRLVAGLFATPAGWVWCTPGWPEDDAGHPFHLVEGDPDGPQGEGPWTLGPHLIAPLPPGDPLQDDWDGWLKYKAEFPIRTGREAATEAAWNAFPPPE